MSHQRQRLQWLTNLNLDNPPLLNVYSETDGVEYHYRLETESEALRARQQWLRGKVIGEPRASAEYTVEELQKWGLVGIYDWVPAEPNT
jgi:hypothetical protein